LQRLQSAGVLTSQEKEFVSSCFGPRKLERSLGEINTVLKEIIRREEKLFIKDSMKQPVPVLQPDLKKEDARVDFFKKEHQRMFNTFKSYGVPSPQKESRIMEIGFVSGAHSIIALERLGMKAMGIDNYYGGIIDRPLLADAIKEGLKSNVSLIMGDITAPNQGLADGSLDIIYSSSVLEHIKDLGSAFREMKRLLAKDGLIIHNYNPFHCPNGGHASGILDNPWGHCRLSQEDYLRYIKELRPHEFERAKEWILNALNPQWTIAKMQSELFAAGFEVLFWRNIPAPAHQLADLTPDIAYDCMQRRSDISLFDLISQNVLFVARQQ
jgi:ubiquinone/menaquinone biosynthesis C-methylase UbiE